MSLHLHCSILGAMFLFFLNSAQAQYFTPITVSGSAFARTDTHLYISSGSNGRSGGTEIQYKQFFSLDLTVPWTTSAPAFKQLSDGPQQYLFPAAFSQDQETMITFHSGTPFARRYSVSKNQWTDSKTVVSGGGNQGVSAVTDPTTGQVYLAGGYSDPQRNSMDIYNFNHDAFVQNVLPASASAFPNRAYYSNVWTSKRKSILYFGGYNSTLKEIQNFNSITEFVPNGNAWSTLVTSNTGPSMRADHCMAISDDGSTMVIYGGRPYDGPSSGEVFMFDTTSQIWKQGVSGPPRLYVACTIAGDNLIIWGGIDAYGTLASPAMLIYSMSNNTWITQYTPPASYLPSGTSPSTPSPSGDKGESSINAGAIAGGVVGGLAVICAIVLFFIFRRRQHRPKPVETDDSSDCKLSPGSDGQNHELESMRAQLQYQQEQLELQRRLLGTPQNQPHLQVFQQQHQQQQLHQYQDGTFNYQPPIVYAAANSSSPHTISSPDSIATSSPDLNGIVAHSSGLVHSGYVDGGSHYIEAKSVAPVIYSPPPPVVSAATIHSSKGESNGLWEGRIPGNPHAILEN
ncbi:Leucine-zipper-like transcriptional regulator 1 [Mortierella sp. AM989]|nr:Leucine-zipper-like transcriptional regulator 1 [Mortierella sp. AM989]